VIGQKIPVILEILVPAGLVALWWLVSAGSQSFYFPPLSEIIQAFGDTWVFERALSDLVPSVVRLLAGYLIATVIGVSLGIFLGMSSTLRAMTSGVLDFFRTMPPVALIPFAILVFGIDADMKISVIAFGALWPILLNTIDGIRSVDDQVRDLARSFQFTLWNRIVWVMLPSASPQIFSGMRASLSISVIMMVISEMLASTDGVGFAVLQAQRSFAIKEMWAGVILLGLVGYVLNLLFIAVEHRVLHWHRGVRRVARQR